MARVETTGLGGPLGLASLALGHAALVYKADEGLWTQRECAWVGLHGATRSKARQLQSCRGHAPALRRLAHFERCKPILVHLAWLCVGLCVVCVCGGVWVSMSLTATRKAMEVLSFLFLPSPPSLALELLHTWLHTKNGRKLNTPTKHHKHIHHKHKAHRQAGRA